MSEQQSGRLMRGGGGGDQLSGAMKLFSSLGLTPSDLNILAEIPENEITVETLPSILMRLKSRKGASGERGGTSSEASYQGGRDRWDPSLGPGPARAQTSGDFGFSSMQNVSSGRGFGSSYGGAGDGRAERPYSELSRQTSYGVLGSGPLLSDPVFMQRRMGSPSSGKVQDFLGDAPSMFPHVCSLCNIDVHSSMEWNQHIKELRHAENSRRFLDTYPERKPGMASGRSGGHRDTPNMSPGLLGASPMSLGHTGGMPSSWGGDRSLSANKLVQNLGRSKVVVVKYDRKPLSNQTLFSLAEMFGTLREHLVLDKKAFLEMDTHEEALDMVNYYKQNPTSLYGKPITFYLSQTLMVIKKIPGNQPMERPPPPPAWDVKGPGICSKVVFFSRLPREEHKKRELLTIAERFGTVQKYLFLKDEAFVQLGTEEDADMLVKYYSSNPLIIEGRRVSLNLCAKYKTLNVSHKVAQLRRSGRPDSTSTKSPSRGREEEKEGKKKKVVKTEETKKKDVKKEKSAVKEEEEEEDSVVLQGGEDEEDDEGHPEEEEGEKEEGAAKDEEQDEDEEDDKDEEQDKDEEEDEDEEQGKDEEEDKDQEEPEKAESVKDEEEAQHKEVPESDEVTAEGVATKGEVTDGQTEATEPETPTDELKNKDEENAGESCDEEKTSEEKMDQDFMENMEDFVTLDELEGDEGDAHKDADAAKQTKKGGMRVVSIMGFHRDYNFLEEILALAKPFGTVERHLVLDRRSEAYIQFAKEEEAIAMHKFYNRNVIATVCGRQVKIVRSNKYPTIQTAASRVVYIGQLPNIKNFDDDVVLKLVEPFGNIRKYSLPRWRRECFIEMETVQEAEKMASACKEKPLSLMGRQLVVYVSRKYTALHNGVLYSKRTKRTKSSSPQKSSEPSEEPQAKKRKEEETKEEEPEQNADEKNISKDAEVKGQQEEDQEAAANQNEETVTADKPSAASLPLPPYDPDVPIGTEHMKMGYYCRICFLFYSNKDTAMKRHCSSQAHYDKLQKHLEKEQKPKTTEA